MNYSTFPNWRRRRDDTLTLLSDINASHTLEKIGVHVLGFARSFGATNLLAGAIPSFGASRREQLSHVLIDVWPQEWSRRYFSNGYLYRDPTIRLVTQGSTPFLWSDIDDLCMVTPFGRRIMDEATEFRLSRGMTLAFSTSGRQAFGFSFAGDKFDLDPCECTTIQLVAAYAFGCALVLSERNADRKPVQLSPRQQDVLRWASEGLTVDEIADRLSISSNTADTHLRAVRQRLGVASTVHAVAEAFRSGLIS